MNVNPYEYNRIERDRLLQEFFSQKPAPFPNDLTVEEMEDVFIEYMNKHGWTHMINNFFED